MSPTEYIVVFTCGMVLAHIFAPLVMPLLNKRLDPWFDRLFDRWDKRKRRVTD